MTTDEHLLLCLQAIERVIPTPKGMHHAIMATPYEGKVQLALSLATREHGFRKIFIDCGDLDMDPVAMSNAVLTCYERSLEKETPHDPE